MCACSGCSAPASAAQHLSAAAAVQTLGDGPGTATIVLTTFRSTRCRAHLGRPLGALLSHLRIIRQHHQHVVCTQTTQVCTACGTPLEGRETLRQQQRQQQQHQYQRQRQQAAACTSAGAAALVAPVRQITTALNQCACARTHPASTRPVLHMLRLICSITAHLAPTPSRTRRLSRACRSCPRPAAQPAQSWCRWPWCSPPAAHTEERGCCRIAQASASMAVISGAEQRRPRRRQQPNIRKATGRVHHQRAAGSRLLDARQEAHRKHNLHALLHILSVGHHLDSGHTASIHLQPHRSSRRGAVHQQRSWSKPAVLAEAAAAWLAAKLNCSEHGGRASASIATPAAPSSSSAPPIV